MVLFECVWGIAALTALAVGVPVQSVPRDVSADVLQQLTLFAEYSAAAYCASNIDSTGDKLTCSAGNCPGVEAASTTTLYEFEEDMEYGDVAGYLAADSTNQLLVMAFRGSRSIDTWIANLDFGADDIGSVCSGCKAHGGFWRSWGTVADSLSAQLESAVAAHPGYKIVFTGHSFGAAMATLGATVLRKAGYAIELYTYGCPRVGNKALANYITGQGSLYRVTHTTDIVTNLPPAILGFAHPYPEYHITSGDGEKVTTADIEVIQKRDSTVVEADTAGDSVAAHGWYFIEISAC